MSDKMVFEVKNRPWYEWALWAIWLFSEIFILQNAIASSAELEPRAATIFWVVFFVLLVAGGLVWFMRRGK